MRIIMTLILFAFAVFVLGGCAVATDPTSEVHEALLAHPAETCSRNCAIEAECGTPGKSTCVERCLADDPCRAERLALVACFVESYEALHECSQIECRCTPELETNLACWKAHADDSK